MTGWAALALASWAASICARLPLSWRKTTVPRPSAPTTPKASGHKVELPAPRGAASTSKVGSSPARGVGDVSRAMSASLRLGLRQRCRRGRWLVLPFIVAQLGVGLAVAENKILRRPVGDGVGAGDARLGHFFL